MANIPGATNVLPGVFTDIVTQSRGVAIPGGARLAAIIGEGSTDYVLVSQALGKGRDGLDDTYTTTTGADGRHFLIPNISSTYPLANKRTKVYKNGVPLKVLESVVDDQPFSYQYDCRVDPNSGQIELQKAHIVDQGYSTNVYYTPGDNNTGDTTIGNLSLLDSNAPPETWTIKCVSVSYGPGNTPILGTAKFFAFGSVSGAKLDANGNPVVWKTNGVAVDNGVLKFSLSESATSSVPGDYFIVQVGSGVLVTNDSLTVNCIPTANLNDPILVQGMQDVVARHGFPSVENTLSIGAQLAFANQAPALVTLQAKPAIPTRRSYILVDEVNNPENFDPDNYNQDDYIFPLPLGVTPDVNSEIHIFATNTQNVETQLLPNKVEFYSIGEGDLGSFITSNAEVPAGYSFCYTVIERPATVITGFDGILTRTQPLYDEAVFDSAIPFDTSYTTLKQLKIIDATNQANVGTYDITGVSDGKLLIKLAATDNRSASVLDGYEDYFPQFMNDTGVAFQIIKVSNDTVAESIIDGYVTKINETYPGPVTVGTSRGTIGVGSTTFDLSTITSVDLNDVTAYKIKINAGDTSTFNNGLYDVLSYDAAANTFEIKMTIVNEKKLRFEIVSTDPSATSKYLVLNHNVIPDKNQLRVNVVDYKEATFYDAGWINALEALETIECDIVVPLPTQTISGIFQNTLAHCKVMSNIKNKKERVMFAGAIRGLKPENLLTVAAGGKPAAVENIGLLEGIQGENITDILTEDLANYAVPDAFGNTFRCVYFYPDEIIVQVGADNLALDGFYIAAAAAGYASADTRIENPFTNKVLSGFTILRNKQFSTLTLENLAVAGVTTLQPVAGGGRIVWGLTTTQSGFPEEQEISIVFIRDRVAKSLRAGFAGYIGLPETVDTPAVLNTRAVILLNALVSQGLITAYANLSVARDSVDPRQWNITVSVQPTYPVNFIYIKVALGQV